ncbi:family 1 glycosylhydrolase [Herbiconiux moechotypicola]|uniref:GH1 family beta-glucosidase n=1 Tax=Herbiconiux moechotypicola TaxID=637393 RepID=A0ABN3DMD1_9MICO|nr:family 1 glycosylhydrolase [Herbiconiux moechotypicola]MCS5730246.1 family 1 glycosylhydrolase [Herbiconiux moechotypicola]
MAAASGSSRGPSRASLPEERRERARDLASRLPAGFELGVATSAFQIEGATHEGGRGESAWDAFTAVPGRVIDGSTADVAADHWHRMPEDVELMRQLGVDSYRFSFAWPRLQPEGKGALRREGVDFYERLLDRLEAAGIRSYATIYHWDTPSALTGGWFSRDTALRFGDLAHALGERFGERIDRWATINEPATVTLNGYALGLHAPGATRLFNALPAAHHQLLAHGIGVQALRAADVRGEVGIVNVHSPVVPATESEPDTAFAALFDVLHNRIFEDPVLLGRYPTAPEGFEPLFSALTEADPADLALIGQPLDFYGLNYYMPTRIAAGSGGDETPDGSSAAMASLPFHLAEWPEFPRTGFGWPVAPEFFGVALAELASRYGDALPPVVVSESGASFPDAVEPDGETGERRVHDGRRIDYLAAHLEAVLASPVDVRGYHVWSLLDNFEWAAGYTQRFGLVHVDFAEPTRTRTPKDSYRWLQLVADSR